MATTSLYLDTRKTKEGEPAPVKLRVYENRKKIRHYKTNYSLTLADFNASFGSVNPSGTYRKKTDTEPAISYKDLKKELSAITTKADQIIKKLGDGFTFEEFEKQFRKRNYENTDVISHFNDYMKELDESQAGTRDLYRISLNSLTEYIKAKKIGTDVLPFHVVTVDFLKKYEKWFLTEKKNGRTSLGIYLRNLRAIFNRAIMKGDINKALYPFGTDKYSIPAGSNIKKALPKDILKALYTVELPPGPRKQARDFWFFSYQCNGMNIRDICELKFENITDTQFHFIRQKTKRNVRDKDRPPIQVPITPVVRAFIDEYCNKNREPDNYVFPIFSAGMSEDEKLRVSRNFVRSVNNGMQKLAKQLGYSIKIRSMEARHTFTTIVTKKAGLEFASEALGHTTLSTTQNYWAGFEAEEKREVANSLLNFD